MWFFDKSVMDHVRTDIFKVEKWCADMESYAIAHVCYMYKVPFIGIYFVASSDYDDIDGYNPDIISSTINHSLLPILEAFLNKI